MAYMSEEGYKKLMAELKELETVERPKISAAIAEARDKGDLSENAEYDAAKEAQGMLEMRINKLKNGIGLIPIGISIFYGLLLFLEKGTGEMFIIC